MNQQNQFFVSGPIPPAIIAERIARYRPETDTGAHDIFLGQVRADEIDGTKVTAIEYSAYEAMANVKFEEIRNEAFAKYELTDIQILHSIGKVRAGEICLFVHVTAKHRKSAFEACRFVVEVLKQRVPVFGKEIFARQSNAGRHHQWKVNT